MRRQSTDSFSSPIYSLSQQHCMHAFQGDCYSHILLSGSVMAYFLRLLEDYKNHPSSGYLSFFPTTYYLIHYPLNLNCPLFIDFTHLPYSSLDSTSCYPSPIRSTWSRRSVLPILSQRTPEGNLKQPFNSRKDASSTSSRSSARTKTTI